MAETNAFSSTGVFLEVSSDGTTFDKVAEVMNLDGPSGSTNIITTTSLDSTYVQKIAGVRDSGQVSAEINLLPSDTSQQDIRDAYESATVRDFRINLTDDKNTQLTFSGFVTEFGISNAVDGQTTASITIDITGPVTWAEAV